MLRRTDLTEEEKQLHWQQFSHTPLADPLSFMDVVWEIDLQRGTVVVLKDDPAPGWVGAAFACEAFFQDLEKGRVPVQDLSRLHRHLSRAPLGDLREKKTFSLRLCAADGTPHLHRMILTPIPDDDGTPSRIYVGGVDLHEEEQSQMARFQELEQFRQALLAGCYFYFTFDVTAGGLIWGDFEARDGTHPIRDSTKMAAPVPYHCWVEKWYELYQPQFDEQDEKNIFSVDYFRRAYARNERLLNVEVKQRSPRGEIEYMHIFVVLLKDPADDHIYAWVIWRDITPFRRGILEDKIGLQAKNDELRRTISWEEQFRQASLSGALLVYNINLTRNLIEDEFYEIVDGKHYPMLQMVGLTPPCSFDVYCQRWCEQKVAPRSQAAFMRIYNREYLLDAYARGEYQLEIEYDTVIGRGIPVTLCNTVLLVRHAESGDIIAMVNGKDITHQREKERSEREALRTAYEAANRANTAKSNFLSRMSHDIRTPMNAIIGMTAIAAMHLDDRERVEDCLAKITVSSKHLLGLINEVLDMSKLESGKIDLQNELFVLPELVENLLTMCKPQIQAKRHELAVSIRGIEHEHVVGDRQRLQQALMNLMSNAIKYTPAGGSLHLTITEKPTNRPMIGCYEFVFEDNGIGMSETFQQRLFEPFERAEDERTRREQGTGLGMTITKNIVQMMNGTIDVKSAPDVGTTVTVTVFLKLQEDGQDISYEQFLDLPILVADDDEIACETTCWTLSELGMKGEWVLTGQEAVERAAQRHEAGDDYYAVILDWKMPGMDGVATARALRRRIGDDVPIIILSSYDWFEIEQEARAAGVNAFISKPLFKSRMAHLFHELMGHNTGSHQQASLEPLQQEDYTGRRALLAEDNDLNAEIAEEIFRMTGLDVERAKDGREALEKMTAAPDGYYDIVFMDIQMPVMDGYQAVRAIRALGRRYTSQVPIVAMTANAFAEDVREAGAAGMNGHVAKPLDFAQLQQILKKWLG